LDHTIYNLIEIICENRKLGFKILQTTKQIATEFVDSIHIKKKQVLIYNINEEENYS